jgi:hypothetical protein
VSLDGDFSEELTESIGFLGHVAPSFLSEPDKNPLHVTAFAQILPERPYLEFTLFMQFLMKDLRSSP